MARLYIFLARLYIFLARLYIFLAHLYIFWRVSTRDVYMPFFA